MKSLSVQPYLVGILVMAVLASGCDDSITEFGYSGQISGLMTDQDGEVVRGNSATTDFRVFVLGPDEIEPLEIRVTHDGTYSNAVHAAVGKLRYAEFRFHAASASSCATATVRRGRCRSPASATGPATRQRRSARSSATQMRD
jgi:hypothetical protein